MSGHPIVIALVAAAVIGLVLVGAADRFIAPRPAKQPRPARKHRASLWRRARPKPARGHVPTNPGVPWKDGRS